MYSMLLSAKLKLLYTTMRRYSITTHKITVVYKRCITLAFVYITMEIKPNFGKHFIVFSVAALQYTR